MTPQEALDAIQSRLEAFEASVAYLPNYMSPEMDAAVQVLADFIKQETHEPDMAALALVLENGTSWLSQISGELVHEGWNRREDWGGDLLFGRGAIANAWGWECRSCRTDVGWCKHDIALRDWDTKAITLHFECGHCGDNVAYDLEGNEVDEI